MEAANIDSSILFLGSLLESDSSSDESEVEIVHIAKRSRFEEKKKDSKKEALLQEIIAFQHKENLAGTTIAKLNKLVNKTEINVKLPESKFAINAAAAKLTAIAPTIYVFCDKCKQLVLNKKMCSLCNIVVEKNSKANNFMCHFSLLSQLRKMLEIYLKDVLNYINREHSEEILSDIDDGRLFRNLKKNFDDNIISLTMNVDGASISNSNAFQLWPVQMYVNCLPPAIRYLAQNIIVTTLFYGKKKPSMKDLLFPLAKELNDHGDLISIHTTDNEFVCFRVCISMIACDLPAKSELQNFVGSNGKFGCGYCYQEGVPVANNANRTTIRFKYEENVKLRSHDEAIELMKRMKSEKNANSLKGVKGTTALLMLPICNDIINIFSIDYMHGLGVIVKDIVKIWLGKRAIPNPPYKQYKISTVQKRELLQSRIMNLKPTMNFRRKPRSILDISDFKASELMHLLWYYLRYTLVGLIDTKIIKNFEKLAAASYILCKSDLRHSEIEDACKLLREFVHEFETIYGPGALTMNIHLLMHYFNMILNCGPLWAHGVFGFENKIGTLKRMVNGTTDYLDQISKKYAATITIKNDDKTSTADIMIQTFKDKKNAEEINVNLKDYGLENGQIWSKYQCNGITYTSLSTNEMKSADYFVRMQNNKCGKIEFFAHNMNKKVLLLHIYNEKFKNFHWIEIERTEQYEIFECNEISEKLLFFKTGTIEYITREPNSYSRASL